MADLYFYTMEGWATFPNANSKIRRFNIDTGQWISSLNRVPFSGTVSNVASVRQQGCWDGTKWYVMSPSGQLFAYTPSSDSWSTALVSGSYLFGLAADNEDKNWCMTSNGRVVFILSEAFDFRQYDPISDSILGLAPVPAGTYGTNIGLVYDGSGSIYAHKGGSTPTFYKYRIATNTWSALASGQLLVNDLTSSVSAYYAYLQGKFWVMYKFSGTVFRIAGYNPITNTWSTTGSITDTQGFNMTMISPYGEENDYTVRIWGLGTGSSSYAVNIANLTVSTLSPLPFTPVQGCNWAMARNYRAVFEWYTSGGVSLLPAFQNIGSVSVGGTNTYQAKVKNLTAQPSGITVSVVTLSQTDADDPVTISNTLAGSYAKSFTTTGLAIDTFTDVFIKTSPTASQTLGLHKQFNILVSSNDTSGISEG